MNWLRDKLTNNETEIPLLWVMFNRKQCKENGKKNSCMTKIHPLISTLDEDIQNQIKGHISKAMDLIRDNCNIDEL